MNKTTLIIIGLIIILVGGYYAANANGLISTPKIGSSSLVQSGNSATQPAVKEIVVTGSNYSFNPSQITVNKGDTVKIKFTTTDGPHDFVLDQFHVATPVIRAGQQADVQFTANVSGQFQYYCSIPGHRQMGMVGTLTVK